ncbi:hypothetical protein AB1Y20_009897 [Prymnesium parvum]|uniref:Glutathione transferase n=1 Tax=Prymnesium parvum TaxID=97485 RepID=A0AB34K1Q1_PRYPA|mmetsp:Transcript_21763/g.52284  ORF Transcript_21763/g.52284 Transcript_21763/m.52284 type:complete len:244 (-) Transcript_21763:485-1216(-)
MARWLLSAAALAAAAAAAEEKACGEVTLRYFDIRGRGEAIRMALHDQGVPFADESFSFDEWGKEKPDGLKARWTAEGKLAFGQVPLLEIDGLELVQTQAILRYLGRKLGWYEGTPAALHRIDLVAEGTEDVRGRLSAVKYSDKGEAEKQAALKHYFSHPTEGARWLGYLDALLAKSDTPFAASTPNATHADYLLLDVLDYHESIGGDDAAALIATMPALTAFRAMMRARPKLKAYLEGPLRRP